MQKMKLKEKSNMLQRFLKSMHAYRGVFNEFMKNRYCEENMDKFQILYNKCIPVFHEFFGVSLCMHMWTIKQRLCGFADPAEE